MELLAKSSALLITTSTDSTVKKAAKLAVYEETMIKVKNHHIEATVLVEGDLKKFDYNLMNYN